MKSYRKISPLLLAAAAPVCLAFAATTLPRLALAAPDASDTSGETLETVTVTARKVSEEILKVPVAVQVLTSKDLDERDVISLSDVAAYTPGLTDDQALGGAARADRSFQQFIIRGMNPSFQDNPTTSIFINGVPIPSALLQNVGNADRIEVLEGPQSAYFGKDTFAGAINVVTKDPPKELGGYVSVEEGTRQTEDYKFAVGGPIIGDKLSFLGSANYNSHEGSYRNAANPSQHLGDQSTLSGDFTLLAKPVDDLTIKFYGLALKEHDGPAATGIILTTPAGNIPGQSNCLVDGSPWLCGKLPGLLPTSPAQNTGSLAGLSAFNAGGKLVNSPTAVDNYGLQRNAYFGDLSIDYFIPTINLTLTSLTGISKEEYSELSDLSNLDGPAVGDVFGAPYTGFAFLTEERNSVFSQEFRIATDRDQPYRFLLGASYVDDIQKSALGSPGEFGFYSYSDPTRSKIRGVFFSAAYDIIPQLTVNFEGRYQYADVAAINPVTYAEDIDAHFDNFLPRAIIQYKFTPEWMAYATYSQGVNTPGIFNTQIEGLPAATKSFFTSAPYNAPIVVQPEKLKNYEIGVKGAFLDGKANLAADIYYDKWTSQLVPRTYTIPPGSTDPVNPVGNTPDLIGWTDNSGTTTAKGLEVGGNIIPIEHVTVNVAGAINDTKFDNYTCVPCASYPSTTPVNVAGNYLPNSSKYSATGGLEYANSLNLFAAKDWYIRTDVIYKSGVYLEALNTSKTPDIELVNLRAGVNWEKVRFELFVNNLFNNKAYTSGFPDDNFTAFPGYYNAVMVGLPQLITGGVRVKYSF